MGPRVVLYLGQLVACIRVAYPTTSSSFSLYYV